MANAPSKADNEPLGVEDGRPRYQSSAVDASRVPLGYKLTEVGVIPEEWGTPRLRECLTQSATYGVVKAGTFQRSGIPMLRGGDIKYGTLADELPLISEEKSREYARTVLRVFDVVISLVGYPGEAAVVSARFEGANISRAVGLLRPNKDLSPAFLACYLNSPTGRKEFLRPGAGSAQLVVNLKDLNELRLPLPPLQEQRAIAAALADVDALLAKLDQLIAKKHDLKQAVMQQLLTGQTRLPGFSGEWKVKQLGEVSDCLDNLRIPLNVAQRNHMKGDFPYCGANGVLDFVSDYVVDDDIILIAEDGGYFDEYAYRPIAYRMVGKCWVNNHAHILKAKTGHDQGLIFFSLVHKNILSYLASGTRAKLNKSEMNKIEVCLPLEKGEQTAIATVLSDMDAEIATLKARCDKTRALKQGMMQELLMGRIRLVQRETKPEDAMPVHDQLRKAANYGRNWAFNEAVIISVLTENFADASHPLGRMRYTKLSYLLHRYANEDTEGYLNKAAGPYNPATRYKGPERIVQTSGYVKAAKAGICMVLLPASKPTRLAPISTSGTARRRWNG